MKVKLGGCIYQCTRLAIVCFTTLAWANVAHSQLSSTLHLKEAGSGPNPTIELEFPFPNTTSIRGLRSLTSPSGDVFNAASILESRIFADLIKTFPSLDAALSYVAGTWHGTFVPFSPPNSGELTFEFDVAPVSPNSLYRGVPQQISLSEGDRIRNGQEFLMSWDYPSNDPMHLSSLLIVPQFNPLQGGSFGIRSPGGSGGGFGSSGVGATRFDQRDQAVSPPGEYQILTTYTAAEVALPLNVEMTFGATMSLNAAVQNHGDGDANPFNNPPVIGLRYSRTADPFEITLVPVPEPTSSVLAAGLAIGATIWRRGQRGSNRRHV